MKKSCFGHPKIFASGLFDILASIKGINYYGRVYMYLTCITFRIVYACCCKSIIGYVGAFDREFREMSNSKDQHFIDQKIKCWIVLDLIWFRGAVEHIPGPGSNMYLISSQHPYIWFRNEASEDLKNVNFCNCSAVLK